MDKGRLKDENGAKKERSRDVKRREKRGACGMKETE